MDTTETNPENNKEKSNDGHDQSKQLGTLLKSYRETANMDIGQAADALCLTPGTLKSLENEDFDKLPEAPYLRGYLRGYAKLANVNSSEVIALYETMRGGNSTASEAQYNFTPSSSANEYTKPLIPPYLVQFGMFAVIALIFAIIYMIPGVKQWSNDIWDEFSKQNAVAEQDNLETVPKPIEKTSIAVANTNTVKPTENPSKELKNIPDSSMGDTVIATNMEGTIKRSGDDSANNTTDPNTTDDAKSNKSTDKDQQKNTEQTASPTTIVNNTVDNKVKAPTDTKNTAEKTSNPKNSSKDNVSVDAAAQAPTPPTAATTTAVDLSKVDATAGQVMVKLVFKDEVWMRVSSKQKKVFSGLKKSGDTEEFKTTKPLSFKVGNAPGVDIYVNGKLYDQTPYMKGVVAKFKVEDI